MALRVAPPRRQPWFAGRPEPDYRQAGARTSPPGPTARAERDLRAADVPVRALAGPCSRSGYTASQDTQELPTGCDRDPGPARARLSPGADGARAERDVPAAVQCQLHLPRRRAPGALPARARHQRPVCLALPEGALWQPARVR